MMKKVIMNGPAEFEMKVDIVNDETGQEGCVTIGLGFFKYPTRKDIADRIAQVPDDLKAQGMDGFRLATKHESWRKWCIERTGEELAMPGSMDWDQLI